MAEQNGSIGADSLVGTSGDDIISGDAGNDTLSGEAGRDLLFGGPGNDLLKGGDGNDTLYGGAGADTLYGGAGDDHLFGGEGDDLLYGEAGNDWLFAGAGTNLLYGGAGDDVLVGGEGIDSLYGGAGADTIYAGPGDYVDGGSTGDDRDTLHVSKGSYTSLEIVRYGGDTGESGQINFLDAQGNIGSTLYFRDIETILTCFTPGARILTSRGEVAVEEIRPDDLVMTRDSGWQPVRWIGRRELTASELLAVPQFLPVRIGAGALGNGLPLRDLVVSPQHRMVIGGARAEMLFGEAEVLVAAVHLLGTPGITRATLADCKAGGVSYIHLLFDSHQVICVDGAWTESFQPAGRTLSAMDQATRDEVLALFPELATEVGAEAWASARRSLRGYEARVLLAA